MELRPNVEERRMSDDAERGKSICISKGHSYSRASTALSRGPLSDLVIYSRGDAALESDSARIPRGSAVVCVRIDLDLRKRQQRERGWEKRRTLQGGQNEGVAEWLEQDK